MLPLLLHLMHILDVNKKSPFSSVYQCFFNCPKFGGTIANIKDIALLMGLLIYICTEYHHPSNLCEILFLPPFQSHTQLMIGLFICCHLVGMSSACINPILYGYLNESFKVQFIEIASCLLCGKKSASNLPLAHRKPSTAKQDRNREEESKQRLTPSPPPGGNELLSISPDIKKKSGETFVIVTADRNGGGKSSAAAVLKSAAAPPSKYSPGRADQTFV